MPKMDGTGPLGNGPRGRGKNGCQTASISNDRCDNFKHSGRGRGRRCCQQHDSEETPINAKDEILLLEKRIHLMQTRLSSLKQELNQI